MSSPVIACASTSWQIGALGEREAHSMVEQLTVISGSMRPPVFILISPYAEHAIKTACQSEGPLIAAQPDCCGQQYCGHSKPEPQTRAAQKSAGSELSQWNKMRIDRDASFVLEVERSRCESKQAVLHQ